MSALLMWLRYHSQCPLEGACDTVGLEHRQLYRDGQLTVADEKGRLHTPHHTGQSPVHSNTSHCRTRGGSLTMPSVMGLSAPMVLTTLTALALGS
jgi:hypothetical protein